MKAHHALPLVLLSSALSAQLEINEVIVDPVGTNSGNQIIEIVNVSGSSFTPTGWNICSPFVYSQMPSIAIPAGGLVQLHINASGIDTVTDFFFPFHRDLLPTDTFQLYKSGSFGTDTDIVDFVSWGGGTNRILQAVNVGEWESSIATVIVPPEGESMSWDGMGDQSTDWVLGPATLGSINGIATFDAFGAGCPGPAGVMDLSASPRPILGSSFTATLNNAPSLTTNSLNLIVGLSNTTWDVFNLPLHLSFLGAPGCHLRVAAEAIVPLGGPQLLIQLPPFDPSLVGMAFYMQAYSYTKFGYPSGLAVSNAVVGIAGVN